MARQERGTGAASQSGWSKTELILALVGSIGAPIGGGIWMGTLQNRVSVQEDRLDKVEKSPTDIAVLQTQMVTLTDEVRGLRSDMKEVSNAVRSGKKVAQ